MNYYAGIDVSLEASSVCLVDSAGKIIRETKVASDSDALIEYFVSLGLELKRIGLEAGPLSQWLYEGLTKAGFDVVLLETRHVKAALSAMIIKTDRKDARGIAQLLRMGWYRVVHSKSPGCQESDAKSDNVRFQQRCGESSPWSWHRRQNKGPTTRLLYICSFSWPHSPSGPLGLE